ncbi:hypothetical protein BDK51DRAFT_25580, partial [Blyttiomyces helicus]
AADTPAPPDPTTKATKRPPTATSLGAKIQLAMMEGSSPDDHLLVTLVVEAMRKATVPTDQQQFGAGGWILVDFPRTRAQAQILEKELSGYEDPKPVKLGSLKRTPKEKPQRRRSLIAPADPKGPAAGALPTATSGIDTVIMIDVENETAVKRAAGRRADHIAGGEYHLENAPPPAGVPGITERLAPLPDDGNEDTQLQYQLAAWEDQEELLKDWFARFRNLQIIDGNQNIEGSFETGREILAELVKKKEREKEEKEREAAEAARIAAAEAIVQRVWPHKSDPADPSAANPPTGAPPVKDDRMSVVEKPSETAAAAVHQQAVVERKPAKPEEEKKGKPGSGRARVTSAGTKPDKSGGVGASGGSSSRAASAGDRGPARPSTSAKERSGADAGGDRKLSGPEPQTTASVEGQPDPSVPPIVRLVSSDGKRMPSKELAEILADQWTTIESTYTDTIKFAFRSLRRERETMIRYFHDAKVNFRSFLERPDRKQALMEKFQAEYNTIEDDLRSDPDAKSELHQRADDLREDLWDLSDKRKEQAEAERVAVVEDKWVEDHFAILANVYITMMQAEADRFAGTRQLALDYYKDTMAAVLPEGMRPHVKVPLINATAASPLDISALLFATAPSDTLQRSHRRETVGSAGGGAGGIPIARSGVKTAGSASGLAPAGGVGGTAGAGAGAKKQVGPGGKMTPVAEAPKHAAPGAGVGAAPTVGSGGPSIAGSGVVGMLSGASVAAGVGGIAGATIGGAAPSLIVDRELSFMENDGAIFADLQTAVEVALTVLNAHDEAVTQEKDKKEKKKEKQPEAAEQKPEPEVELPQEYHKLIECEEHLLRRKLERLKLHAMENLRELRNKGVETYSLLDEWILLRFQSEMDAIRAMLVVIKESIEAETRLPNQLVLEGERFKVDYEILTFEPDPEPRPESPVEKQAPDQFTVLQLLNLALQFREAAPTGHISWKEFVDCFQRLAILSAGTELLPDYYVSADPTQFQQLCIAMDVFDTGFVSWRRFLLANARISPAPTLEHILYLKASYEECESYMDGKVFEKRAQAKTRHPVLQISKPDYMRIGLWFEEEADDGATGDEFAGAKFNRPAKLKAALFYIFAVAVTESVSRSRANSLGTEVVLGNFSTLDEDPREMVITEEKASAGELDADMTRGSEDAPTASGVEGVPATVPGVGFGLDSGAVPASPGGGTDTLAGETGPVPDAPPPCTSLPGLPGSGPGVQFLGEHDKLPEDGSVFDVSAFLMALCVDESPKVGLQKAFAILSEREDGACSVAQLYQMYHHGLVIVDETHRLGGDQNNEDPFPQVIFAVNLTLTHLSLFHKVGRPSPAIELLKPPTTFLKDVFLKIFEDAGVPSDGYIAFDAFIAATESQASTFHSCPLFQLEDIGLLVRKSRPSSAITS